MLCTQGTHPTCRTWVWTHTSTAERKKAAHANNYYGIMVNAGEKSTCLEEIEQVRSHCRRHFSALRVLLTIGVDSEIGESMMQRTWPAKHDCRFGCLPSSAFTACGF